MMCPVFQLCSGEVCLRRIHTSYLYIMHHPSGLGYHQAGCTCHDTGALHNVVVWYRFTIFCRPNPRVRQQVEGTHGFCLTGRFGRLGLWRCQIVDEDALCIMSGQNFNSTRLSRADGYAESICRV
jgi:hypothetical protein